MVIIVLGIDGLEFNLVEEYNLQYLKQKGYSKLVLEDFDVIVTPPIWASMITGVVFREMLEKFIPIFHSSPGFWGRAKGLLPWKIRILLRKTLGRFKNIFEENPLEFTSEYLSERKIPTIFDECISWHNAIPGFSLKSSAIKGEEGKENNEVRLAGMLPEKAFDNKKVKRILLKQRKILFEKQVRELFNVLSCKDDYELIFWYTNWIDLTGHLEYGYKLRTMDRYLKINLLVRRVQEKLGNNDVLHVISDHGMIPRAGRFGFHSDHGFFSSSTGETIRKPPELYSLIKKNIEDGEKK